MHLNMAYRYAYVKRPVPSSVRFLRLTMLRQLNTIDSAHTVPLGLGLPS